MVPRAAPHRPLAAQIPSVPSGGFAGFAAFPVSLPQGHLPHRAAIVRIVLLHRAVQFNALKGWKYRGPRRAPPRAYPVPSRGTIRVAAIPSHRSLNRWEPKQPKTTTSQSPQGRRIDWSSDLCFSLDPLFDLLDLLRPRPPCCPCCDIPKHVQSFVSSYMERVCCPSPRASREQFAPGRHRVCK